MRKVLTLLIVLIFLGLVALILFPVFAQAKMGGGPSSMSNLWQMGKAFALYEADCNDKLPGPKWMDAIMPYAKSEPLFHAREIQKAHPSGYGFAFNSMLLNADLHKIGSPNSRPLVYESTSVARNSVDPVSSLPNPPWHFGGNEILYPDGHCKEVKR